MTPGWEVVRAGALPGDVGQSPGRAMTPDLRAYDRILIASSGGKDSVAAMLAVLDAGADPARVELHHHLVDGRGPAFMDWPSTEGWCRALAAAFRLPLHLSWRDGGFLGEMLREDRSASPVRFEAPGRHAPGCAGGRSGQRVTRLRFPQVGAVTAGRWCSAILKIDVLDAVIRAQDRFLGSRTLVVTGERAEESRARAGYATFERHRTDTRDGPRRPRWVDHWRPVHGWTSADVWAALRRRGVVPAPAYRLGFGRLSCLACIFGSADQWATVRWLAPELFARITAYEGRFGCTIQRGRAVAAMADRGRPFAAALAQPELARRAMQPGWNEPVLVRPDGWTLPAGATGDATGPT